MFNSMFYFGGLSPSVHVWQRRLHRKAIHIDIMRVLVLIIFHLSLKMVESVEKQLKVF